MKVDANLSNNNLIILLKTFTAEERKEFERFVQSPFFTSGRNYLPLLKALYKYSPEYNSASFTRSKIYARLYPGKAYKESVMKTMLSRMNEIAEEFLFQKAMRKNTIFLRERSLIGELSKRGLKSRSEKMIKRVSEDLASKKKSILDKVTEKDLSSEIMNHHYNFNERHINGKKIFEYQLLIIYSFLSEFLINDAVIHSEKNYWDKKVKKDKIFKLIDSFDVEKIMKAAYETDKSTYSLLRIFYLLRMSFRYPEKDEFYADLRKEFQRISGSIDLDFKKYIMNAMMVLCTAKFVAGNESYKREAFILRKKIYDENLNIFSEDLYLKNSDYRTAVLEALSVGEVKWAEEFSEKYNSKLQPEFRQAMKSYAMAHILYSRKKFNEALNHANRVNISHISFKLDLKNLIAMIYYETDSIENLISLLNTYSRLISNSESEHRSFLTRHSNFVKILKKLLSIKHGDRDKADIELLKVKIRNANVTSKTWLTRTINKL